MAYDDSTSVTVSVEGKSTAVLNMPDYVANNDPVANAPARVTQQQVLPSAVKGRNVAVLQETGVDFKYGFVPDGSSIFFSTATFNGNRQLVENFPAYQIYVGPDQVSLLNDNNRMPEVISSSHFPYYTKESLYDSNNSIPGVSVVDRNNRQAFHTLQVRNSSGVAVWIGAQIYTKYMVNNSNVGSTG